MQTDNLKAIPIRDYLDKQGIYPVKEYSGYGMYKSPFRDEHTPSFKVDYYRNLWYDFGSGEGGSIIDLVMQMHKCNFIEAADRLNAYGHPNVTTHCRPYVGTSLPAFSFHRNPSPSERKENGITLTAIKPVGHPKLLEYLESRKIDHVIASGYCKEIHYQIGGRCYYGIGFANDAGGYEIRNPSFKGCIAPKDITHIRQPGEKDTCYLFEGFMDYFSLLTIQKQLYPEYQGGNGWDTIILNSTANLQKAMPLLTNYEQVYSFHDNDKAGETVFRELQKELGCHVRDASHHYSGYKDLNEYLCAGVHLKSRQTPSRQTPVNPVQKRKRGMGI